MLARAAYWLEKAGLFFAPQRQLYQKNVLRPVGCAGRASLINRSRQNSRAAPKLCLREGRPKRAEAAGMGCLLGRL
jgi:hypothetical protein